MTVAQHHCFVIKWQYLGGQSARGDPVTAFGSHAGREALYAATLDTQQ
jgi:hypothetical protein